MSVSVALQQINLSALGPKGKANAAALLELAHDDNGYACVSWEELSELFDAAQGTVRRQLGEMHKARIIHYSTNGDGLVYVIFKAWTPAAPAPTARGSRVGDQKVSKNSTENARPRAKSVEKFDGEGAEDPRNNRQKPSKKSTESVEKIDGSYTRARARSVRSFVRISDPDPGNERTNEHAPEPAPSPPEQARSLALLQDPDVGLEGPVAHEFAAVHRFEHLLRHVCEWRRQLDAGVVHGRGALITRIRRDFDAAIVQSDRDSPLYRRHVPPEDTQADDEEARRRKYDPSYW